MWNRIKALIVKEFLAVWRDKRSRLVLVGPPIIQLFIFAFAATLEVKNVPVAILNRDTGKQSWELTQRFEGSPYFKNIFYISTPEQARDLINSQNAVMVIEINDDFSAKVKSGQTAIVQLILDGRKTNVSQILAGYTEGVIQQYNIDQTSSDTAKPMPVTIVSRNWFNPNLDYILYTVPGLVGILSMLIALLVTSLSVAREREFGTFDQLLVSPLDPVEILIGKAVPAFIIAMFEGTIIVIAGYLFFKVPFVGSIFALYFSMAIFLISIVGVGLFFSSISKTQQQAILASFVFMVPAILLSGYATPVENIPEWLQATTVINPLKYFLVIVRGVLLKDMPFSVILENIVPIAVIAVFTLSISAYTFRRRLE